VYAAWRGLSKLLLYTSNLLCVGITLRVLSAHVLSFYIPGSAFAALTAARLTTNLPREGQSIQVRWWYAPCGGGMYENGAISHGGAVNICEGGGGQAYT
jgi:hypothetical protein